METYSPLWIDRLTPRRAATESDPDRYTLVTLASSMTGGPSAPSETSMPGAKSATGATAGPTKGATPTAKAAAPAAGAPEPAATKPAGSGRAGPGTAEEA